MMNMIRRLVIEHSFALASAALAYLAGRWLLDLSTPEEDWDALVRWWDELEGISFFALRWYRWPEYRHQLRGARLLATV